MITAKDARKNVDVYRAGKSKKKHQDAVNNLLESIDNRSKLGYTYIEAVGQHDDETRWIIEELKSRGFDLKDYARTDKTLQHFIYIIRW